MKKDSKKVYLDANALIAFLVNTHPQHKEVTVLMESLKEKNCCPCISLLVVDEVVHSLFSFYRFQKEAISQMLSDMLVSTQLQVVPIRSSPNSLLNYLDLYTKSGLGPRDSLHLFTVMQGKINYILTFDKDFRKKMKDFGVCAFK
ncbi:MAG TPA: type II toxin-antitoxin system VapC family toxin [bacterium]|nr:type II toxin-antitoxin system VapC family toxin [bacterium]